MHGEQQRTPPETPRWVWPCSGWAAGLDHPGPHPGTCLPWQCKDAQTRAAALLQHRDQPGPDSPAAAAYWQAPAFAHERLQAIGENLAQGGSVSAEPILGLTGSQAFKQGKLCATRR